jgi:hypothetical protein
MVMVVVMMMVVGRRGECRTGKHHQQQDSCKNLFHGMNVAQVRWPWKRIGCPESREERARSRRAQAVKPA